MQLELSSFIKPDLNSIGDYIARDNPVRAKSYVSELISEIASLTKNPLGFRLHPEIGLQRGSQLTVVT